MSFSVAAVQAFSDKFVVFEFRPDLLNIVTSRARRATRSSAMVRDSRL